MPHGRTGGRTYGRERFNEGRGNVKYGATSAKGTKGRRIGSQQGNLPGNRGISQDTIGQDRSSRATNTGPADANSASSSVQGQKGALGVLSSALATGIQNRRRKKGNRGADISSAIRSRQSNKGAGMSSYIRRMQR